ncbi:hypothetical protein N2152v2_007619 [Parachlorella kessleri]
MGPGDGGGRAAAKLTPQLVPEALHLQFLATGADMSVRVRNQLSDRWNHYTIQLSQLIEKAQRVGSDFTVALCGYQLATVSLYFGTGAVVEQELAGQVEGTSAAAAGLSVLFPPSAFLGWLQQAEQAHARCSAVLPLQWTVGLERRQHAALAWKPWLQRLQQEGDRWQLPAEETWEVSEEEQQQKQHPNSQQQVLKDLKLTRSVVRSPASTLGYRNAVYAAAWKRLQAAAKISASMSTADVACRIIALVDHDSSVGSLLAVAAGIVAAGRTERLSMLLACNNIVKVMQLPERAAQLRRELEQLQADLPHRLLSFEQLLAYFVWRAYNDTSILTDTGDSVVTGIAVALRATVDVLPQLAPEHLQYCFHSIEVAAWYGGPGSIHPLSTRGQSVRNLIDLLRRAQQQGSDNTVAHCGYKLAAFSAKYGAWAYRCQQFALQQKKDPESLGGSAFARPSAFLGWLQQAKQAHARCNELLPLQWTLELMRREKQAAVCKPWLQLQQKEGDCWQQEGSEPNPDPEADAYMERRRTARNLATVFQCSGCGMPHSHLQTCADCKRAQYCSRQCQRDHWKKHKEFCRAHRRE